MNVFNLPFSAYRNRSEILIKYSSLSSANKKHHFSLFVYDLHKREKKLHQNLTYVKELKNFLCVQVSKLPKIFAYTRNLLLWSPVEKKRNGKMRSNNNNNNHDKDRISFERAFLYSSNKKNDS
jgi:hypothetical protein